MPDERLVDTRETGRIAFELRPQAAQQNVYDGTIETVRQFVSALASADWDRVSHHEEVALRGGAALNARGSGLAYASSVPSNLVVDLPAPSLREQDGICVPSRLRGETMSVFDWRGPEFLIFFVGLAATLTLVAAGLRRVLDPRPGGAPPPHDNPYLIACLRGGTAEAIRLAVVTLVDREQLVVLAGLLRAVPDAALHLGDALERAVVCAAGVGATVTELVRDRNAQASAALLEQELARRGYCVVPRLSVRRLSLYFVCAGFGTAIALHKITLALDRGHSNVFGLIACVVLLWVGLALALFPRRTPAGDRQLRDLKQLFSQSAPTRRPDGHRELSWQMAVFGVSALSVGMFPALLELFPSSSSLALESVPGTLGSSDSGWSSSGDGGGGSDGSSCDSGGGSGCGGCGSGSGDSS